MPWKDLVLLIVHHVALLKCGKTTVTTDKDLLHEGATQRVKYIKIDLHQCRIFESTFLGFIVFDASSSLKICGPLPAPLSLS